MLAPGAHTLVIEGFDSDEGAYTITTTCAAHHDLIANNHDNGRRDRDLISEPDPSTDSVRHHWYQR